MSKKILLTGATGYVGSKLLVRLLEMGEQVHVLTRSPEKLKLQHPSLLVFEGDVRSPKAVTEAMRGCDSAYYLIHGLDESHSFEYQEAKSAQVFTQCSNELGLEKIIYLGGLGDADAISPHLRSRHLTGSILALGRARVLEFRASIVLGVGSTSYEIIKALVSRLPFLIDPKNLRARCQPIYWKDLIEYLALGLLDRGETSSQVIEIGGPDQVGYADLLKIVADHSSIDRKMIPVPELDPRLIAEVFEFIVPEHSRVGRHLIESLIFPTLVEDDKAQRFFPEIRPRPIQEGLDEIGKINSDLGTIVSKEHTMQVLMSLIKRFPEFKILRGINFQSTVQDLIAKQMTSLK